MNLVELSGYVAAGPLWGMVCALLFRWPNVGKFLAGFLLLFFPAVYSSISLPFGFAIAGTLWPSFLVSTWLWRRSDARCLVDASPQAQSYCIVGNEDHLRNRRQSELQSETIAGPWAKSAGLAEDDPERQVWSSASAEKPAGWNVPPPEIDND